MYNLNHFKSGREGLEGELPMYNMYIIYFGYYRGICKCEIIISTTRTQTNSICQIISIWQKILG